MPRASLQPAILSATRAGAGDRTSRERALQEVRHREGGWDEGRVLYGLPAWPGTGCSERGVGGMQEYTAIVKRFGDWWIGWIEEVPGVNCQERSREELLETLTIALGEALEFNRQVP